MNAQRFERIKKLTEVQSTSGFEHNIREVIRSEMTPYVDEIQQDGLGGIFGLRHSEIKDAPTVMVAAHMDEVGFMLASITDEGFFRVWTISCVLWVFSIDSFYIHQAIITLRLFSWSSCTGYKISFA